MNKEVKKITEDVVIVINALEELTAKAIKENNANPNKAGFTSIQDAMGIGIMYSLNSSFEFHLQRANEMQLKAQANYKNSGSATWFGENEHRERVIVECLQEIMEELGTLFSKPSINIFPSGPY